jgi:hypothetical protein
MKVSTAPSSLCQRQLLKPSGYLEFLDRKEKWLTHLEGRSVPFHSVPRCPKDAEVQRQHLWLLAARERYLSEHVLARADSIATDKTTSV